MSKYNVLWLEDDPDKFPTFKEECEEDFGMKLHVYKIREEGIAALEHNLKLWDAVLLDAKMPENEKDPTTTTKGLRQVIDRINQLSSKKKIPYFIFTGQPDLMSDKMFEDMVGEFYKKTIDDEKLLNDMLAAIERSPKQQIKSYYHDFFSASERLNLGSNAEDIILSILISIHNPTDNVNFVPKLHYNPLRQFVEYIFRALGSLNILPNICFRDGKVNLNQCSLYLAGKDCDKLRIRYSCDRNNRIVPPYIEGIVQSVLHFGNINSHTVEITDEEQAIIESLLSKSNSRFLIYGFAMQMMEVVLWFDGLATDIKSGRISLLECYTLPTTEGSDNFVEKVFTPEFDEELKVWHCDDCMLAIKFWEGGKVILTEISPNTSKNPIIKTKYPYFAKYKKK